MAERIDRAFRVVVVGAGIGGLAVALRLASAGCAVLVVESARGPGGKIRTVDSAAGPVDRGPTVLTLRDVFEDLFAAAGESLSDRVDLVPLPVIARHFWSDGTVFDITADRNETIANAEAAFGRNAARDLAAFTARARRLFDAFDAPMMRAAEPSQVALAARVLRSPRLLLDMAPHRSLMASLGAAFREPRLAQLFARYATYVGGTPQSAPALLALISEAEARGVWAVRGGMGRLARAIQTLAEEKGAIFAYGETVRAIDLKDGRVTGVQTDVGHYRANAVVFNGDPRALEQGRLGPEVAHAVPATAVSPRSLSAWVHAFAARPRGPDLSYHNVFFDDVPNAEFDALARGERPRDATLYVCAQDRAGTPLRDAPERFEIILNGAPAAPGGETRKDRDQCRTQVFDRLRTFGLSFDPEPGIEALTTPTDFAADFPASLGSLYGLSPAGLTAGLRRPRARTAIPGLYLCGGGAHPGAGVPMATLSGQHAAAAIISDRASILPSGRTATHGGMSTASAATAAVPSPSSGS